MPPNEASAAQGPLAKRQRLPSSRLTGHDLSVGQRGAKPVQPPQQTAQAASAAPGAAAPAGVAGAAAQSLPTATMSGDRATSTEAATARASPLQSIGSMQWPSGQQPGRSPPKSLPSLPKPVKALHPAVQSKGPGRLKPVWRTQEQVEHINKKSSMEQLGQWSGFKTNALKYQIVADHINSLCHDVDPIKFPHKRLWKDCEAQTSTLKNKFDKTKAVRNKMIALTKAETGASAEDGMGSVQEQQASQEWCINGMADPADDVPWFWLYAAARKAAERERQRVLADADADAALDDSGLDGHTYGKDAPQRQMMSFIKQRAAREDAAAEEAKKDKEEAKKDKEARNVRDERMLKAIETSSNAVNMLVNWMMSQGQ